MMLLKNGAMNAEEYSLPPTGYLRCISIVETAVGALAVIGSVYDMIAQKSWDHNGWSIFQVICAVLLLGTGVHGVRTIRRLRMRILNGRAFCILSACNGVLCVIYSTSFCVLLFAVIFLATRPDMAHSLMAFIGYDGDNETGRDIRKMYDDVTWRKNMLILGYITMVLAAILLSLTGTAATICSRLSSSVSAARRQVIIPHAAGPLIAGPGYGANPMAPLNPPPSYSPYPPLKQDLH